jgi:hypothetical protein
LPCALPKPQGIGQLAGRENFVTFGGLENLKEHGVIMLGQTATTIAKERSPGAVAAFYATIAAVATLGLGILLVSANIAFVLAH